MLRLLIGSLKIIVILVVALLIVAGARQLWAGMNQQPTRASTVEIQVRPGDGPAEVSQELERQGVIRSGVAFRAIMRLRNAGGNLTAGKHTIIRGMSMNQIIDVLTTPPRIEEVTVTFREGIRLEEYATLLKEAGLIATEDDFLKATRETYDFEFLRSRPPGAGLEGYLFPDTYNFVKGLPPRDIVTRMLENFGEKFSPEMRSQADSQRRTVHQVLILASIIEREAQKPEERRTIAGVYLNRLDQNMPLQADPTVQYGIGKPGDWWPKGQLLVDGLRQPGPFNTYLQPGLPPAPIANPGLASIQAALEPEEHEYLYFVAKGDGSHAFARTLDEHNENVRQHANN